LELFVENEEATLARLATRLTKTAGLSIMIAEKDQRRARETRHDLARIYTAVREVLTNVEESTVDLSDTISASM